MGDRGVTRLPTFASGARRRRFAGLAAAALAASSAPSAAPAQPPPARPWDIGEARHATVLAKTLDWAPTALASQPSCPASSPPQVRGASVFHAFPELAWHVCIREMAKKGLWVGPVHMFQPSTGSWQLAVKQAGPAEIFVPYHGGGSRPYLLDGSAMVEFVGPPEMGADGTLIRVAGRGLPSVISEIRYRGVAWLCKQTAGLEATRHGYELAVWGIVRRGHDSTIVEYGFRDDGAITFRTGHTGYNAPLQPAEAHTHTALWYVNPAIPGAAGGQSAHWLRHNGPFNTALDAIDVSNPITTESARPWDEKQMATLLIEGAAVNPFGNRRAYELVPMQGGVGRHFGPKEAWTQNDVYVTRARAAERGWIDSWAAPDDYLLPALNGETVVNQDLAIWTKTSARHRPGDEDKSVADSLGGTTGITLARWSGFRMEPHNLFDSNPLGGPSRCGP